MDGGSEGPRQGPRWREDGFTPQKRRAYLEALAQYGNFTDAAKVARVSRNTALRHRRKWPDFRAACDEAMARAAGPLETLAWQRATQGCEEKIIRKGEVVQVKVKPSDAMLRLLLQAANPEKYGRTGALPIGRMEELRAQIRREIEQELHIPSEEEREEGVKRILRKLRVMRRRKLDEGWRVTMAGEMVPPGYGPVGPEASPIMEDPIAQGWEDPYAPLPSMRDEED